MTAQRSGPQQPLRCSFCRDELSTELPGMVVVNERIWPERNDVFKFQIVHQWPTCDFGAPYGARQRSWKLPIDGPILPLIRQIGEAFAEHDHLDDSWYFLERDLTWASAA